MQPSRDHKKAKYAVDRCFCPKRMFVSTGSRRIAQRSGSIVQRCMILDMETVA